MSLSLIRGDMLDRMRHLAAGTPPGALVEVGVYKGGSAEVLQLVAREQGRGLYLFDTFTGIPMQGPHDRHAVGDFADTSVEAVRALVPRAEIFVGLFPDTYPAHVADRIGPVAFVHADADQYESTIAIGRHLGPRMVPGGLMLFDDYCLEGCRMAILEMFPAHEQLTDGRALVRF